MIYRITLPLPPSVNGSLMAVVRGRYSSGPRRGQPMAILAPTKSMEDWKERAADLVARGPRPLFEGPVEVFAEFWVGTIASDCSNRLKAVEDILRGAAYADDKQVVEDHAFKRIALEEHEQRVEIVVRPADVAEHAEVARRLEESFKRAVRKIAKELEPTPAPQLSIDTLLAPEPTEPKHWIGDSCPGGHERLEGANLRTLGPRREPKKLRELASSATYEPKR